MRLCVRTITSALTSVVATLAALSPGVVFAQSPPSGSPPSSSGPISAASPTGAPDVATLLFTIPEWSHAPAGTIVTYTYSKKASEASLGPSFDDHILLTVGPGDDPASRTAEVKMFSGANAKPAGPFRSDQQNPVLLLMLEENVQELSKVFKANPRYLKNAIRKAWRDDATIKPAQVAVDGKTISGTEISIQPFRGDPEASKMVGLDTMVYTVDVAEGLPGYVAAIEIRAPAAGVATFNETLRYGTSKLP